MLDPLVGLTDQFTYRSQVFMNPMQRTSGLVDIARTPRRWQALAELVGIHPL